MRRFTNFVVGAFLSHAKKVAVERAPRPIRYACALFLGDRLLCLLCAAVGALPRAEAIVLAADLRLIFTADRDDEPRDVSTSTCRSFATPR